MHTEDAITIESQLQVGYINKHIRQGSIGIRSVIYDLTLSVQNSIVRSRCTRPIDCYTQFPGFVRRHTFQHC